MTSTMLKDSTLESLTPSVNTLLLHEQNFASFFKYLEDTNYIPKSITF
jgi:hypothetical protein